MVAGFDFAVVATDRVGAVKRCRLGLSNIERIAQDLVVECDALITHARCPLGDLPQEPVRYYPEQRSLQSPK